MSNSKQNVSKSKLWIRILCLVLALIMVGSVAYLAVSLIIHGVMSGKSMAKSTAALCAVCTPTATAEDDIYVLEF